MAPFRSWAGVMAIANFKDSNGKALVVYGMPQFPCGPIGTVTLKSDPDCHIRLVLSHFPVKTECQTEETEITAAEIPK